MHTKTLDDLVRDVASNSWLYQHHTVVIITQAQTYHRIIPQVHMCWLCWQIRCTRETIPELPIRVFACGHGPEFSVKGFGQAKAPQPLYIRDTGGAQPSKAWCSASATLDQRQTQTHGAPDSNDVLARLLPLYRSHFGGPVSYEGLGGRGMRTPAIEFPVRENGTRGMYCEGKEVHRHSVDPVEKPVVGV